MSYSVPLLYPGQRLLFKIVLLVEVPGDLSDHGVGVAHKAAAVLQKKKDNNKIQLHMDKGSDYWLIIPKSDFIDDLAADAGTCWQPGDANNLQLGPERSTRR